MLIRFLSVEAGFDYLQEMNFIESEVQRWRRSQVRTAVLRFGSVTTDHCYRHVYQNVQYVLDVEADMDEAFSEHVYENAGSAASPCPRFLPDRTIQHSPVCCCSTARRP